MRSLAICSALALSIAGAGAANAKTGFILVDASSSARVLSSEAFAQRLGAFVHDTVRTYSDGDRVRLQLIGVYGADANTARTDITISRRARAPKVADYLERWISALPTLVENGTVAPQPATQILGALYDAPVNCAAGDEIIILSDGMETSPSVDWNAAAPRLPAPSAAFLSGCTATLVGAGQFAGGGNPQATRIIGEAWRVWFEAAGVTAPRVLADW